MRLALGTANGLGSAALPGGVLALAWLWLGGWLQRRGLAGPAVTCFRRGAGGRGRFAGAAALRWARQLHDEQRHAEARVAFERALDLAPADADARARLADCLAALGQWAPALRQAEQALATDATQVRALAVRCQALYELQGAAAALPAAQAAVAACPDAAALQLCLAAAMLHEGYSRDAIAALRRAQALEPGSLEAHHGLALLNAGKPGAQAAVLHYELTIALHGDRTERLAWLAMAQLAAGDGVGAEATSRTVLARQPRHISTLYTLSSCLSNRAEMAPAIAVMRDVLALRPGVSSAHSNIAFLSTYRPDLTPDEVMAVHLEWDREVGRKVTPLPPVQPQPLMDPAQPGAAARRLRIGYVSGDLCLHPVGFLLRDVLQHHDRSAFEVHAFSSGRQMDQLTAELRSHCDGWHALTGETDEEAARQVREAGIDILLDLSGHTSFNRLIMFAMRPAPVQASWLGYFHSTGLSAIDYFITDPHTSPARVGQRFSETPVCLPHTRFLYAPLPGAPDVAPMPAAQGAPFTFGGFNRLDKLTDAVVAAWSRILLGVPGSRLLLKARGLEADSCADALRDRFAAHGVAPERLLLRGPSGHLEMLAEYAEVDLALDPFPFTGGMTTLEALWMGVPVATLDGHGIVARQSCQALANLGLDDGWVFADVDAYVAGVVAWAGRTAELAALRATLRERMAASPLCQPEPFVRALEDLYRAMWAAACDGRRLPAYAGA